MRGRRLVAVTLGVVLLLGSSLVSLVASPGEAVAKSGYFAIPAHRTAEFRLKGSGGYSIAVFASHGQVSLTAWRGGSSAEYSVRGLTSTERIKARFPNLGRISVRFHPSQPPHRVSQRGLCKGQGEVVQPGKFVGTISFEGEQGYTTVQASRATGKLTKSLKQTCKRASEGNGGLPAGLTLLSASSQSERAVVFALRVISKKFPGLDGSNFSATVFEARHGGLAIFRSIEARAGVATFATSETGQEITSATISPPLPFTGTASYQRTEGSSGTWTGTLAGTFLGRDEVSLAGATFTAEISG